MEALLNFEIVPHVGIGPVRLGAAPSEVEAAIATIPGALPRREKGREKRSHLYFDNALQVEFGQSGASQFIGISCHNKILTCFRGRDVFDMAAPDLFALIASWEQTGRHEYNRSEYLFPEQLVTLWEAAEQYDRKGAGSRPVFAQVGVGTSEYRDAVLAIRARAAAKERNEERNGDVGTKRERNGDVASFLGNETGT